MSIPVEKVLEMAAKPEIAERKDVYQFLVEHKGTAYTIKALAAELGYSEAYLRVKLDRLVSQGLVEKKRVLGMKATYYWAKVSQPSPQAPQG